MFISIMIHVDPESATPFIHTFAPKVVEYTTSSIRPTTDAERDLIIASIDCLETLVAIAEESKRITLLTILLCILVSFLLDDKSLHAVGKVARSVHDEALNKLMKIEPQYPAQFCVIMTSQTDLKSRLEIAVKSSQSSKKAAIKAQEAKAMTAQAKPSITLKTSFNFS